MTIRGLTLKENKDAELLAQRINPVFGTPYRVRRLLITGGKLVDVDRIAKVPWPEDIHIDPTAYISSETNEEVNCISVAADGPNADGSMHHGSIEYLPDYPDRETMLRSAADIADLVYRITGHKPRVYLTDEDRNEDARWCMGEQADPPEGYGYDRFVEEFGYE